MISKTDAVEDDPVVLVVDDDPDMLALLSTWFEQADLRVMTAASGAQALTQMDLHRPDLVMTDLVMDEMDGLKLLRQIHLRDPVMPVIILSGEAQVADAIKAAHLGVSAFLTKSTKREPVLDEVRRVLANNARVHQVQRQNFACRIIYRSAVMSKLIEKARLVASSDSSVLITGNTGTGKELLAEAIHAGSSRSDQPFVSINCSAIPDQLLESELFGHEKGAFTGAISRHEGLFQSASGGTLFLDEIGDMPLNLQSKLLRVLQDFKIRPVGSNQSVPIDVRIISATHQDLDAAVAENRFREDLYYRLSVVPLHLPGLDERRDDIAPILEHLLRTLGARQNRTDRCFSPDALDYLQAVAWPGNIRQLANVVEQCLVLSSTQILPLELVTAAMREQPAGIPSLDDARRDFERRYLIEVLRICKGQVANAARMAGRNRTEFYKLLSRHHLEASQFRQRKSSPENDS